MPKRKPNALSVLVVDDVLDGLELLREYLTFRGFSVQVARDGAEAIDLARKVKPAIVLMDLSMPGIDGCQAATILKNDPHTRRICVIAVTGRALQTERDAAIAAGCDGVILKPFDITTLADALPHVLDNCAKALNVPGLALPWTQQRSTRPRSAAHAVHGA